MVLSWRCLVFAVAKSKSMWPLFGFQLHSYFFSLQIKSYSISGLHERICGPLKPEAFHLSIACDWNFSDCLVGFNPASFRGADVTLERRCRWENSWRDLQYNNSPWYQPDPGSNQLKPKTWLVSPREMWHNLAGKQLETFNTSSAHGISSLLERTHNQIASTR